MQLNQDYQSLPKVLYLDDEPLAGKYLSKTLRDICVVETVENADLAIEILRTRAREFSVLITDYCMPKTSGADFLREVERLFPKHFIYILVSAYADKSALLKCMEATQLFGVLEKPIDREQLRTLTIKALRCAQDIQQHQLRGKMAREIMSFLIHELTTPLASIALRSETISADNSHLQHSTEQITLNARYCIATLESFQKSFIGSYVQTQYSTSRSANEIVTAAMESLPLTVRQREFIHYQCAQDFLIRPLPECISMVVSTLVSNALSALQEVENPALHITVGKNDAPFIKIEDNGYGLPLEVVRDFHALQAKVRKEALIASAGHGRGLIFAKHIMEAVGGQLLLDSKNQQTVLVMLFPA